jgi:hypothetical protein
MHFYARRKGLPIFFKFEFTDACAGTRCLSLSAGDLPLDISGSAKIQDGEATSTLPIALLLRIFGNSTGNCDGSIFILGGLLIFLLQKSTLHDACY